MMSQKDLRISCYCAGSHNSNYEATYLPAGIVVKGIEIGDDTRKGVIAELERRIAKLDIIEFRAAKKKIVAEYRFDFIGQDHAT